LNFELFFSVLLKFKAPLVEKQDIKIPQQYIIVFIQPYTD